MSRSTAASKTPTHPFPTGSKVKITKAILCCPEIAKSADKEPLTAFPSKEFASGTVGTIRRSEGSNTVHFEHKHQTSHYVDPDEQYKYQIIFSVSKDVEYVIKNTDPANKYMALHRELIRDGPQASKASAGLKFKAGDIVRASKDLLLGPDGGQQCIVKKDQKLQVASKPVSTLQGGSLADLERLTYEVNLIATEKRNIIYTTNFISVASFELC